MKASFSLLCIFICMTLRSYSQCTLPQSPIITPQNGTNVCLNFRQGIAISNYNSSTTYTWNLSEGGTLMQSAFPGNGLVTWTSPGIHRITVTPTNSCGTGVSSYVDITVANVELPVQPTSISGSTQICKNVPTVYSVEQMAGLTVDWLSSGSGYTITTNGSMATVTFSQSGYYSLGASYNNGGCSGYARYIGVTVIDSQTPGTPEITTSDPSISSLSGACRDQTVEYTTFSATTNVTYNWSLSGGGTIQSNGSTATVTWTSQGTFNLSVYATHFCGSTSPTKTISVNVGLSQLAAPGNITGTQFMCTNQYYNLTIEPVAGAYNYQWNLGSSKPSTSTPTYQFKPQYTGNQTLNVRVGNGYCLSPPSPLFNYIASDLNSVSSIVGLSQTCSGNLQPYSVTDSPGWLYSWTATNGTITGPANTNAVNVAWASNMPSGSVMVTVTNACGSFTKSMNVVLDSPTRQLPSIVGSDNICSNSTYVYNLSEPSDWTASWQSPGGQLIYTNPVQFRWTTAGNYVLTATLRDGCRQTTISKNITVNNGLPPPTGPGGLFIQGKAASCINSTENYSVQNTSGVSYLWTLNNVVQPGDLSSRSITWSTPGNYVLTVTSYNASCQGHTAIINVQVSSMPSMTSSNVVTICSEGALIIELQSSTPSTYSWVATDNPNTTGESLTSQTSSTINNTIVNSTNIPQTVIYTVTPSSVSGSCIGETQTITVTVNPKPAMTNPSTANACSGNTLNFSLTSSGASSFSWVASDNPNTIGESTTVQNSSVISDVITNNTTSDQSVTYTVTPTSTAGGCIGTSQTVTISVKPKSIATASDQTICFGGTTNVPITSNLSGTTFSWTAASTNVSGATAGSGTTIAQTLTSADGINNGSVVYTITPTLNGCSGAPKTVTVSVAKLGQTITFNSLLAKTYGNPSFALSAFASSALPVTYTSSNTSVATVSGNMVTIIGGGTTDITANQVGNNCFNSAPPVVQTLTVNKQNQSITFSPLSVKTYGDAPFTLSATASSGLAISYSSSNTAVATVSGNTVTIVGAGSAAITASQPGNSNYNATTPVSQTLTVNKANQTITFNTLPTQVACSSKWIRVASSTSGLSISYSSSVTSNIIVSGDTLKAVSGTGSSAITASQAGNANYNAASSVTKQVFLQPATQTVSFDVLPSPVCINTTVPLHATSSSGLPISYTSSSQSRAQVIGNSLLIRTQTGTVTIGAKQSGNDCYNMASASQTITIVGSGCTPGGRIASDDQTSDLIEDETKEIKAITAYPNPASRELTIQLPESAKQKSPIRLFDQLGKVVHESYFDEGETIKTIDTRDFKEGLYIIKLDWEKETVYRKVVIVH